MNKVIINALLKSIKSSRRNLSVLVVVNILIGLIGYFVPQMIGVKGNIILEIVISCVFTSLIAVFTSFWTTLTNISNQFTSKEIDVGELIQLSNESDMILYVSSMPKFSDWFKPELMKYLILTSPTYYLHRQNQKQLTAKRIFVFDNTDISVSIVGNRQSLCRTRLAEIHGILGIRASMINPHNIKAMHDNPEGYPYDFCIGFKMVKTPNSPDSFEAIGVAIPNGEKYETVTAFSYHAPGDNIFNFYKPLADKLLISPQVRNLH